MQESMSEKEILTESNALLHLLQKEGYKSYAAKIKRNHYVLPALIEDQKVDFLIDTGCTHCTIDEGLAKDLGLQLQESGHIKTMFGEMEAHSTTLAKLDLGGFLIKHLPVHVNDGPTQGTLGLDLLVYCHAVFDARAGVLHVQPPQGAQPSIDSHLLSQGYTRVALVFRNNALFVPVKIAGREVVALLDTGCNLSLLDKDFSNLAKIRQIRTRSRVEDADGNTQSVYKVELDSISLGSFSLPKTLMGSSSVAKRSSEPHPAMVLGLDLLTLHHAIIDLANGAIYLK